MEGAAVVTNEEVANATKSAFVDPSVPKTPVLKQQASAAAVTIPAQKDPAEVQPEPTHKTEIKLSDLSDEDFDAEVARRTKGAIKSLKEVKVPEVVKTKEEKEKEEADEKNAALEFVLSNGSIKREDYELALGEKSKSNRDIALVLHGEELKEINPKITAEEIEESFRDYYMEEAEEGDSMRKMRLKEMNKMADAFRKEKYGFLDTIDSTYQDHKAKEANKGAIGAQIDTVFDTIPDTIEVDASYTGADSKETEFKVPYKIDEADFKAIKKEVRKNMVDLVSRLGTDPKSIKDADIRKEMESVLKGRVFDKMMKQVATDAANKAKLDTEAHYKAIPVRQANFTSTVHSQKSGKVREFSAEERAAMHSNPQRN